MVLLEPSAFLNEDAALLKLAALIFISHPTALKRAGRPSADRRSELQPTNIKDPRILRMRGVRVQGIIPCKAKAV